MPSLRTYAEDREELRPLLWVYIAYTPSSYDVSLLALRAANDQGRNLNERKVLTRVMSGDLRLRCGLALLFQSLVRIDRCPMIDRIDQHSIVVTIHLRWRNRSIRFKALTDRTARPEANVS